MVRLLVERNDVAADSKDNRGQKPLSRAAQGGHEAVVKLLRLECPQILTIHKSTPPTHHHWFNSLLEILSVVSYQCFR